MKAKLHGMPIDGRSWLLAAGDLGAFLLFGLLGLVSHERELTAEAFARSVLPFAAAWVLIGGPLGVFQMSGAGRPAAPIWRVAAIWLIAGTAALVARGVIFDRTLLTAFFVIGLLGNGMLLLAWRLLYPAFTAPEPPEPRQRGTRYTA
jgi:hypothetical protein